MFFEKNHSFAMNIINNWIYGVRTIVLISVIHG